MSSLSIEQLRKLFNSYSPLYTNQDLYQSYVNITGDVHQSMDNIRQKYNKEITKGLINEAVVKSSFVKRFCVNKSPRLNTTIFELNTIDSRADLCVINGKSSVYEIKTEYDTFNRLEKQLKDYEQVFEYIYLIIPVELLDKALDKVNSKIGILTYRLNIQKSLSFDIYRKASLNDNINYIQQLNQLTKKELERVAKLKCNRDKLIQHILNMYSKEEINKIYKQTLKTKYNDQWNFLINNKEKIKPLDYQWFFQNNLSTKIVYK